MSIDGRWVNLYSRLIWVVVVRFVSAEEAPIFVSKRPAFTPDCFLLLGRFGLRCCRGECWLTRY